MANNRGIHPKILTPDRSRTGFTRSARRGAASSRRRARASPAAIPTSYDRSGLRAPAWEGPARDEAGGQERGDGEKAEMSRRDASVCGAAQPHPTWNSVSSATASSVITTTKFGPVRTGAREPTRARRGRHLRLSSESPGVQQRSGSHGAELMAHVW